MVGFVGYPTFGSQAFLPSTRGMYGDLFQQHHSFGTQEYGANQEHLDHAEGPAEPLVFKISVQNFKIFTVQNFRQFASVYAL
jgi:hypothetical protein